MVVEGPRDLLSEPLAQRHHGGRGQLPAIGGECGAAGEEAARGIQGPAEEQGAARQTEGWESTLKGRGLNPLADTIIIILCW